jgi:hypothetical protein
MLSWKKCQLKNPQWMEKKYFRDSINKELSRLGYHLRLSYLTFSQTEMLFNYIEPIHNWLNELPDVDHLVVAKIKEAQNKLDAF